MWYEPIFVLISFINKQKLTVISWTMVIFCTRYPALRKHKGRKMSLPSQVWSPPPIYKYTVAVDKSHVTPRCALPVEDQREVTKRRALSLMIDGEESGERTKEEEVCEQSRFRPSLARSLRQSHHWPRHEVTMSTSRCKQKRNVFFK